MSLRKISPIGTYVFERGGLTNSPAEGAEPVNHFAFCPNCECEVPADSQDICLYCFKEINDSSEY